MPVNFPADEYWDLGLKCLFWPAQSLVVDQAGQVIKLRSEKQRELLRFLALNSGGLIGYSRFSEFYLDTPGGKIHGRCNVAISRLRQLLGTLQCDFLKQTQTVKGQGCFCPKAISISLEALLEYPQAKKLYLATRRVVQDVEPTTDELREELTRLSYPKTWRNGLSDASYRSNWLSRFGGSVQDANGRIESGLRKRYHGVSIENLVDTISPYKPAYLEYQSTYVIRDRPNDDKHYDMFWELQFSTSPHQYVIAYVHEQCWADVIAGAAPQISDYTVLSDSDLSDIEYPSMSCVTHSATGRSQSTTLEFKEIPRKDYASFLGEMNERDYEHIVRLIMCELPEEADLVHCVRKSHYVMRSDDHLNYWIADRPMFVDFLAFDCRDFGKRANLHFHFLASFGAHVNSAVQRDGNLFVVPIRNWVVKGQGAYLWWS